MTCYLGCEPEDMSAFDMLILSPGVSPDLDFIKEAQASGAEIIGELEIAYRIGHGKYVAITGLTARQPRRLWSARSISGRKEDLCGGKHRGSGHIQGAGGGRR